MRQHFTLAPQRQRLERLRRDVQELSSSGRSVHPVWQLQQTIGNRAVGRLLSARWAGQEVHSPAGTPWRGPLEDSTVRTDTGSLHGKLAGSLTLQRNAETGDKKGGKKAKPKAPKWTRKLKRRPRLLDGRKASYDVIFTHGLPTPPNGATQLWQVVEAQTKVLSDECKLATERRYLVDIVDIGERKEIKDQWAWINPEDPCFARETSQATVGFDDGESDFAQQASVRVSEEDAKDLLSKMAGPKGTYSGVYSFVKTTNCPECPKLGKLQKEHAAPSGEFLEISGVGKWKS